MKWVFLLIIGVLEETVNILYYKAGQKNHKYLLSILTLFRGLMWYYVLKSIFLDIEHSFLYVLCYIIGNVIGDWISLYFEPKIDKFVLKLKSRKGRKKKRWFLQRKVQRKK